VHGLIHALRAIFWGSIMLMVGLFLFSILMVELVHPVNKDLIYDGCSNCHEAFSSVSTSMLTLFKQIVAGDSWGQVTEPVIREAPWTAPLFVIVVITIGVGLMNLILAVIVERASEGREADQVLRMREKSSNHKAYKAEFMKYCEAMDTDNSGTVTLREIKSLYNRDASFQRALTLLDITRDELSILFKIVDSKNEGKVTYDDFCENFFRMKSCDMNTMLTFMMCSLKDVKKLAADNLLVTKTDMAVEIALHSELLARQTDLLESISKRLDAAPAGSIDFSTHVGSLPCETGFHECRGSRTSTSAIAAGSLPCETDFYECSSGIPDGDSFLTWAQEDPNGPALCVDDFPTIIGQHTSSLVSISTSMTLSLGESFDQLWWTIGAQLDAIAHDAECRADYQAASLIRDTENFTTLVFKDFMGKLVQDYADIERGHTRALAACSTDIVGYCLAEGEHEVDNAFGRNVENVAKLDQHDSARSTASWISTRNDLEVDTIETVPYPP